MQYTIENEYLRLTVDTHGAEAVSVVNKATGAEMIWCGDPAVWGRHAPILFPYTGKLTGGKMIAKGKEYAGGQHGFARDVEHTLVGKTETSLTLVLQANEETRTKWPYEFELRSTFELVKKRCATPWRCITPASRSSGSALVTTRHLPSRLMMPTPLRIMSSVLTSWKAPCA